MQAKNQEMVNHKDIESAMIVIIKVAYSQGKNKYDKMGASYVGYLKHCVVKGIQMSIANL